MLFYESAASETAARALRLVAAHRQMFDDLNACFFGISCDPSDAEQGRIAQQIPGIRHFLDYDRVVSSLYKAAWPGGFAHQWILVDPTLRVLAVFPIARGEDAIAALKAKVEALPSDSWAPVLEVANVLPEDICAELIRGYETDGGKDSGFMRDIDGKTVLVIDNRHKQRRDWSIDDEDLRQAILGNINRHLTVPLQRAFQFTPTRIERHIVACYEAKAGYFRPHRDNTTKATAHRKFAVTINLNAGDYDGGDLCFPEFGQRTYRAPTGGAIVFSCSLLHEAKPVTKGRRYAYLPFLYDEEAAALREASNPYLDESLNPYRRSEAS